MAVLGSLPACLSLTVNCLQLWGHGDGSLVELHGVVAFDFGAAVCRVGGCPGAQRQSQSQGQGQCLPMCCHVGFLLRSVPRMRRWPIVGKAAREAIDVHQSPGDAPCSGGGLHLRPLCRTHFESLRTANSSSRRAASSAACNPLPTGEPPNRWWTACGATIPAQPMSAGPFWPAASRRRWTMGSPAARRAGPCWRYCATRTWKAFSPPWCATSAG